MNYGNTIVSIVDRVSRVVGMELGLRKCVVAHIEQGKLVKNEDYLLDEKQ